MSPTAKTPRGRVPAFYRPETYKAEESLALLMRRVLGSLATQVDKELEPLDLTSAQWVPLYKLHLGHASTAAELARKCELDAGAITRMLDRLEAKNFVRRVRSADDRRVVNLEITDEGREVAGHIPAAPSSNERSSHSTTNRSLRARSRSNRAGRAVTWSRSTSTSFNSGAAAATDLAH